MYTDMNTDNQQQYVANFPYLISVLFQYLPYLFLEFI